MIISNVLKQKISEANYCCVLILNSGQTIDKSLHLSIYYRIYISQYNIHRLFYNYYYYQIIKDIICINVLKINILNNSLYIYQTIYIYQLKL